MLSPTPKYMLKQQDVWLDSWGGRVQSTIYSSAPVYSEGDIGVNICPGDCHKHLNNTSCSTLCPLLPSSHPQCLPHFHCSGHYSGWCWRRHRSRHPLSPPFQATCTHCFQLVPSLVCVCVGVCGCQKSNYIPWGGVRIIWNNCFYIWTTAGQTIAYQVCWPCSYHGNAGAGKMGFTGMLLL